MNYVDYNLFANEVADTYANTSTFLNNPFAKTHTLVQQAES